MQDERIGRYNELDKQIKAEFKKILFFFGGVSANLMPILSWLGIAVLMLWWFTWAMKDGGDGPGFVLIYIMLAGVFVLPVLLLVTAVGFLYWIFLRFRQAIAAVVIIVLMTIAEFLSVISVFAPFLSAIVSGDFEGNFGVVLLIVMLCAITCLVFLVQVVFHIVVCGKLIAARKKVKPFRQERDALYAAYNAQMQNGAENR